MLTPPTCLCFFPPRRHPFHFACFGLGGLGSHGSSVHGSLEVEKTKRNQGDLFWDGEFTWPELKSDLKSDLRRLGIRRLNFESACWFGWRCGWRSWDRAKITWSQVQRGNSFHAEIQKKRSEYVRNIRIIHSEILWEKRARTLLAMHWYLFNSISSKSSLYTWNGVKIIYTLENYKRIFEQWFVSFLLNIFNMVWNKFSKISTKLEAYPVGTKPKQNEINLCFHLPNVEYLCIY